MVPNNALNNNSFSISKIKNKSNTVAGKVQSLYIILIFKGGSQESRIGRYSETHER